MATTGNFDNYAKWVTSGRPGADRIPQLTGCHFRFERLDDGPTIPVAGVKVVELGPVE